MKLKKFKKLKKKKAVTVERWLHTGCRGCLWLLTAACQYMAAGTA